MPRTKPPAHRASRGSAFGTCHTFVTLSTIEVRLTIIIILTILVADAKSQNYYLSLALEEMSVYGIDTLLNSPSDVIRKTFESSFYNEQDSLEHLYTCEFRKEGDVLQTKFQTPPKKRTGVAYFKVLQNGAWEKCNRKGKLKFRRPSRFFTTSTTEVTETDSIVVTREFWVRKKDTIQSGFMNKYLFRSEELIEHWSARCSSADVSCEWNDVKQCHIERYTELPNDSAIVRYYKCKGDNEAYSTVKIKKSRDSIGRINRIDRVRERQGSETIWRNTTIYYFHEEGYCEKIESFHNGELSMREITIKTVDNNE